MEKPQSSQGHFPGQAPPEARENLPHPSGDGRGAGDGLGSWAGQLHLLSHTSTSLCHSCQVLPGHGEGAVPWLELVAQAQQPELAPGQRWECWKGQLSKG